MKKVEWVSQIELTSKREAEIESCFSSNVEFHYPKGTEKLEDQLEDFKAFSNTAKGNDNIYSSDEGGIANSSFGEKAERDRLTVMDNFSGLADKSKKFASFLTVSRKFNYTCVYIFHNIYPEKSIWRKIPSQINSLNIFLASDPLESVHKILEDVFNRKTRKHIPQSALWISRLFIELANRIIETVLY